MHGATIKTTIGYLIISYLYFNGYMFWFSFDHQKAIVRKLKAHAVQFM